MVENQLGFGPVDPLEIQRAWRATAPARRPRCSEHDFSKAKSTLHSVVRDWSDEGAPERAACYAPCVAALRAALPAGGGGARDARGARAPPRVLVPGSGLGRLVLEVCAAGYEAQGNEFSYQMLLVSNFILNAVRAPRDLLVFPWLDQPSNCVAAADRWRAVRVPDVLPAALLGDDDDDGGGGGGGDDGARDGDGGGDGAPRPRAGRFSMCAGEFLHLYQAPEHAGAWDGVVTCFFIDTAPVVFEYVATISRALRPGGVWVNLGPLLYHWAARGAHDEDDDRYAQSVELAWDELRHAILAHGFELQHEEWKHCTYTANPKSMMRTVFDCILFTAVKR